MVVRQYQIILVNLDPTVGSEIQKTGPCVVLSPNEMNKHLFTIVIAPMTTNMKGYPTRVPVRLDKKDGMIAIDQIRTVDRKRIIKFLGELNGSEIRDCKKVLKEAFVD